MTLEADRPYLYRSLGRPGMCCAPENGGDAGASPPPNGRLDRIRVGPRIPDWESEAGGLKGSGGHALIKRSSFTGRLTGRNVGSSKAAWTLHILCTTAGNSNLPSPWCMAVGRQLARRVFVPTPAYPNRECEAMRRGLFGLHSCNIKERRLNGSSQQSSSPL